jgi:hypothetical protein
MATRTFRGEKGIEQSYRGQDTDLGNFGTATENQIQLMVDEMVERYLRAHIVQVLQIKCCITCLGEKAAHTSKSLVAVVKSA